MRRNRTSWPLERVLFALAGSMTLVAAILAATVSTWFLVLAAVVGVNQWALRAGRRVPGVDSVAPGLSLAFGDL